MPEPIPSTPRAIPSLRDALRTVNLRFRPAWVDALSGYSFPRFQQDLVAGLVVGIVALPLAIAFAIASGADPRAGLVTAALAGMVVAIFGGSRVQVVGPTGAFVVILYGITQGHGLDKLFVATFMAGVLLVIMGLFRLGTLIKFIPYPVTTGFTAGIAVIIFLGQIQHIFGLRLNELGVKVPGDALGALDVMLRHVDRLQGSALAMALATVFIILAGRRFVPKIPGPALALLLLTLVAYARPTIGVQTVGALFDIPSGLPAFAWPDFSVDTMREMAPSALTIALLGAIESLLSAVVADGMTGFRHDSNQELVAQGLANLTVPLFGGIAATGAIARTATNVQMGARTPVAAFTHGLVVFAVLAAAAPLVAHIPMAVLGGILAVVAWNMSGHQQFRQLLRMPMTDAGVMIATFGLTILIDLTFAVSVGMVLAAGLFLARMANMSQVNVINPETDPRYQQHSLEGKEIPSGVVIYSVDGPFFFGAAERFEEVLSRTSKDPKIVIFRMRHVPYLDATALNALVVAVKQLQKRGATVILSAVQSQPLDLMMRSGFTKTVGDANIQPNIDAALARARALLGPPPSPEAQGPPSAPS